jgi:hypothetical protein
MSSRFDREYAIQSDVYGIDPLLDTQMDLIQSIATYSDYAVSQHERMALDLISINAYGTDVYWWHIMVYNGITRPSQVIEGLMLRIPNVDDLIRLASNNNNNQNTSGAKLVDRIITI